MKREWKPGDVVDVAGVRAMYVRHEQGRPYTALEGADGKEYPLDSGAALVVLDPDDREQVERLCEAFMGPSFAGDVTGMVNALRSLLEPPKVFAHYPGPVVAIDSPRWTRALCGKAWKSAGPAKGCERCPECAAIVEAGWIA